MKKEEKKKVNLGITVIDNNFAGAFLKNDTSNGAFTTAGAEDRLGSETTRKPRFN